MTIIRVIHNTNNPYVQINKESLWDSKLSLQAKGLWACLLSRPSDWKFRIDELARSLEISEDTVLRVIKILIEAGYAYRFVERDEKGKITRWEYLVFECSMTEVQIQEILPTPQKPRSGQSLMWKSAGYTKERENTKNESLLRKEIDKEKEGLVPPLDPPPIFSSKRKKKKEEKIQRADRVFLTDLQWQNLIDKIGQERVTRCIERLNDWKVGKSLEGGNDYSAILRWVVKAVEEEGPSERNKKFVLDLKRDFPKETADVQIKNGYIMLPGGKDLSLKMNNEAFERALITLLGGTYHG